MFQTYKKYLNKVLLVALCVSIFSFVQSLHPQQVNGQQSNPCVAHNVHGELWSSNIGWVYLNCNDSGGGSMDFGVDYNETSGELTGYGWSPSVGFLKFGGLGCPAGYDPLPQYPCDVKVSNIAIGNNYPVGGWAKFITADNPGVGGAGGWDGWVSMSQYNDQVPNSPNTTGTTNYGIGVSTTLTNTTHRNMSGMAWGSTNIGWLGVCTPAMLGTCDAYVDTVPTSPLPTLSLTASQNPVSSNPNVSSLNTTLSYSTTTPALFVPGTTICTAKINNFATSSGAWYNLPLPTSAIQSVVVPISVDNNTYSIDCTDLSNGGVIANPTTIEAHVTIRKVALSLVPSSNIVPVGGTVTLTYQATEGVTAFDGADCTATSTNSGATWVLATHHSPLYGVQQTTNVVVPNGGATYTIDCLALVQGYPDVHILASTQVGTGATGLNLVASPAGVTDQNHTTTLTYLTGTPANFTGPCTATHISSQSVISSWDGSHAAPSPSTAVSNVDVPENDVIYKITCPASVGGIPVIPSPYATVTVARPSITLTTSSSLVPVGDQAALSYSISGGNAYFNNNGSCTATSTPSAGLSWNGLHASPVGGTVTVQNVNVPTGGATYTISCPVTVPGGAPTVVTDSVFIGTSSVSIGLSAAINPVPYSNPNTTLTYFIPDQSMYPYYDAVPGGGTNCTASSSPQDPSWVGTKPDLKGTSTDNIQTLPVHIPANGADFTITCDAKIGNTIVHPSATVHIDTAPVAMNLIATPSIIPINDLTTSLKYSILSGLGNPPYAWGGVNHPYCVATSNNGESTWDSTQKTALTNTQSTRTYSGVHVDFNPEVYHIECPVEVSGILETVNADAVVHYDMPLLGAVTLSENHTNLCVAGSPNGQQNVTLSWVDTYPTDTSCTLYRDGVAIHTAQVISQTDTVTYQDGPQPIGAHQYQVRCTNNHNSSIDTVTTYSLSTTSPIDCSTANWGISLSGGPNTICSTTGTTAALSWQPWGTVPSLYTSSIVYSGPNANQTGGAQYATSNNLSGSVSGITAGNYYWVKYTNANNDLSPASGVIQITQDCSHIFNGPASVNPLCPAGTVGANHVPFTVGWSSNATSCQDPDGNVVGPGNHTFQVTGLGTKTVSCTWSDANISHTGTYGPQMLAANNPICTTPPAPVNIPKVKEE